MDKDAFMQIAGELWDEIQCSGATGEASLIANTCHGEVMAVRDVIERSRYRKRKRNGNRQKEK